MERVLSAVRSTYDVNASWWKMFLIKRKRYFTRLSKRAPFYSRAVEDQMREFGANARKAQNIQMETVKDYLDKMESVLKDKEEQG